MRNTIKIKKWGNGKGILLPKPILELFSLDINDEVSLNVSDDAIILTPIRKKHLTLAERFADYKGETRQKEFWSDYPVGKETL